MPQYSPPIRDMQFLLHEVLDAVPTLQALPAHASIDADTLNAVLDEGGKFAAQVLAPINLSGDAEGCHLDKTSHAVTAPQGFKQAYAQYVEGGWPSLSCDPAYGGQGLPLVLNQCFFEMLNSANQAWTMYPGLSHGAYEALHAHGTDAQKALYLPKLTSGQWTGTMCLTEPHCGTDLGLLRTKAEPLLDGSADGTYRITGQKIFISAGEHDLAENILHLVLARLPDAPAGSKGISLFLVPKFNVNTDGSLGARNGIFCGALEHKMGIHGNATCQMLLDGALGTLVGQPHKGLAAMFVMMNAARLGVGNQSLGLTEVAYQNAAAYAKDRIQMRALSGPKALDKPADPIIVHPDVRKMLLTARAYAEGARALLTYTALQLDVLVSTDDDAARKDADDVVSLLTPIVKAFVTDNGWTATSACQQVFGGHGYIREWGMEQFVRDARIAQIYEGTNGIQAMDLVGRKLGKDGGRGARAFFEVVGQEIAAAKAAGDPAGLADPLDQALKHLQAATMWLAQNGMADPNNAGAGAYAYMQLMGLVSLGWMWLKMAGVSARLMDQAGEDKGFHEAKLATARYFAQRELVSASSLRSKVEAGADSVMALPVEAF